MSTARVPAYQSNFRLAALENATSALGAVEPGFRLIGVTKGQFSLLELIRAVVRIVGRGAEVSIATWGIGKDEALRLGAMLETGELASATIIVDRSMPTRHHKYFVEACRQIGEQNILLTRTHAKFVTIQRGDWRIVITSSMNLNQNPRCEHFTAEDCAEAFEFFDGVVDEIRKDCCCATDYVMAPELAKPRTAKAFGGLFGGRRTRTKTRLRPAKHAKC